MLVHDGDRARLPWAEALVVGALVAGALVTDAPVTCRRAAKHACGAQRRRFFLGCSVSLARFLSSFS